MRERVRSTSVQRLAILGICAIALIVLPGANTLAFNACEVDPVVVNNLDANGGSLRQAMVSACPGSTITFTAGVVSPITLTSGELTFTKDLTIVGPGATLEITRHPLASDFRILHVPAGLTVTLDHLEITNGADGILGGGVLNEGTLTILNSTVSGNQAGDGGGIANDASTAGQAATLTIQNTTVRDNVATNGGGLANKASVTGASAYLTILASVIEGNSAGAGGGVYNEGWVDKTAAVTVTNTTISGNVVEGPGGGLYNYYGTVTLTGVTLANNMGGGLHNTAGTLTLNNTIVAANIQSGGTPYDIEGGVEAASANNLIGEGLNLSGIIHASNGNQIGTLASPIDAKLGPLQNNGGPTKTHALLKGSPALDAGDNALAAGTTDQRGTGFGRTKDSADADAIATVDIGAFEVDPTIEDIPDQSTSEDQPLEIVFNVGDAAAITSVTASADVSALLPAPANLAVTGSGSTRTLTLTPGADQSGTAIITVTVTSGLGITSDTFVLTVNAVNDPPTLDAIPDPMPMPEDGGNAFRNLLNISAGGDELQTLVVTATSSNTALIPHPTVFYGAEEVSGYLSYAPLANAHGSAIITVTIDDGGAGTHTVTRTFTAVVFPIADTPSVVSPIVTDEDVPATIVINRNPGDGSEVTHFLIQNITGGFLFQNDGTTPIVYPEFVTFAQGNAGLKFLKNTPNAFLGGGQVTIRASLSDSYDDVGGLEAFADITVNPVADTPVVTNSSTAINTQTTTGLKIDRNAWDSSEVTHFKITGITNGRLFHNNGFAQIFNNQFISYSQGFAGLKFTPNTDSSLPGSFRVQGAVDNIGTGLSAGFATATITLPCEADPVVTTNADSGPGSLRYWLGLACPDSTITFDMAQVESPIGLISDQLTIDRNVTIQGPGADQLTVERASGTFRIMGILPGLAVTIRGLTLANGMSDSGVPGGSVGGGGIYNEHSTLTIIDSALTGHTATDSGAAIYNDAYGAAASLTIVNSTLSGNQAGLGGAIYGSGYNGGTSTVTLTNTTLSGNTADIGGGLFLQGNDAAHSLLTITNSTIADNRGTLFAGGLAMTPGTPALRNTIVARNFEGPSPGIDPGDVSITLDPATSFNNVIGVNSNLFGVTDGVSGNRVGTTASPLDPRLGPLAFNGGTTRTHALLAGSPALDAGSDAFVVAPPFLDPPFTDQRGPGFDRFHDAADADTIPTVDIGAFEAITAVEDITNQATNEEMPLSIPFSVGGPGVITVTATSDNPTLVPNVVANLEVIDNGGGSRILNVTPAPNQTGTATITVTATGTSVMSDTFVLTVNGVNDQPTLNSIADPPAIDEDAGQQTVNLTGIGAGTNESQTLVVTATSDTPTLIPNPTADYSSPNATGSLTYTPVANAYGTAIITVTVNDGGGGTQTISRTFTVTVNPVNDPPTLDVIADPAAILEDAGQQTVNLSGIGSGASNESQTLSVTATSNNTALIPNPTVTHTSPNATGSLTYTPVANANGTAIITVTLTDNGGGTNTFSRTFTVTVNGVNDPPTLDAIGDPSPILEDTGLQSVSLAGIAAGAGESQTLTVTATSNNTALIPNPAVTYVSPNATGSLSYTPVANANGSAVITVTVTDDGGSTNTFSRTFTVTVTSVNDPPTLNAIGNPTFILEDAGLRTVNFSGVSAGAGETQTLTVTATSNNLALIPNPTVNYTSANTTGSVSYTPVANASGSAIVTVTVDDGGSGTHTMSRTFTVDVLPENDLPTIAGIANQQMEANTELAVPITVGDVETPLVAVAVTATSSNQTVIANAGLFTIGSGASRTLIVHPDVNQAGTATITVTVNDQTGGLTSTSFVVQVLPVLFVGNAIDVERNSGTRNLTFPVTLFGSSAGAVSVNYTTRQGTAIEGVDYAARAGTVTIPAGMTTTTITVPVMGDLAAEIDETFSVHLSGVSGAVLALPQAVGTILDNDVTPPIAAERVDWTRYVGATATNGTLVKAGTDGWNAGGSSSRRAIAAGDGSVEFSVTATDQGVALGLSTGDTNTELSDIDFAIVPYQGQVYVTERGVPPEGTFGTYAAGDRFAVVVSGGVVSYQQNGVTFYTSTVAPHYPLLVDGALYTADAALADVVFAGPLGTTPRQLGDFDGDGTTDVVIYRPSNGMWYTLHSGAGHTESSAIPLGDADDILVPGDYDGDGIADIAIYRPATGVWGILTSSSYFTSGFAGPWGAAGDRPVTGDYDGDGRADITVFRPSTGMWYSLQSSTEFATFGQYFWGNSADITVPGDYDGDGKTDPTVFRPSNGMWYSLQSSTGYATYSEHFWGNSSDITVPGDFDGDGLFDPTVYRPANGRWYSLRSSTNYTTYLDIAWGAPGGGDVPVMGDYDGDGKADVAVFRPSSGTWYVLRSVENYTTFMPIQWGLGAQYPALRRP